jgi:V8-like Glu-specific endopeptidase
MVKILILEDEAAMRNKHVERLEAAGFTCYSTHDSHKAIDWADRYRDIRFALIDQILKVQPIPDGEEGENQQFTGEGVIRQINTIRSDMRYIFVTFAPKKASIDSNNNVDALIDKTRELTYRNRGVIALLHKSDIEQDEEGTYEKIIDILRDRIRDVEGRTLRPMSASRKWLECARYVCKVSPLRAIDGHIERNPMPGTGWLIGSSLVLTCWHVVRARHQLDPIATPTDLRRQLANLTIEFHHRSGIRNQFGVEACLHHNVELDYALLRLTNRTEPSDRLESHEFLTLDLEAQINEQTGFHLLQHPLGNPDLHQSKGWMVQSLAEKIWHNAESIEGSSGAPTLNENCHVIAMHQGRDKTRDLAVAIEMKAIMTDLQSSCPAIYDEIMTAQRSRN